MDAAALRTTIELVEPRLFVCCRWFVGKGAVLDRAGGEPVYRVGIARAGVLCFARRMAGKRTRARDGGRELGPVVEVWKRGATSASAGEVVGAESRAVAGVPGALAIGGTLDAVAARHRGSGGNHHSRRGSEQC